MTVLRNKRSRLQLVETDTMTTETDIQWWQRFKRSMGEVYKFAFRSDQSGLSDPTRATSRKVARISNNTNKN